MIRSLLAFFCVSLWAMTVGSSSQYLNLRRNPTYDDVLPLDINMTSGVQPVDQIQCARSCQEAEWCNSFFYNDVIKACLPHRIVYTILPSNWNSAPGWRFYEVTSVCPGDKAYIADRLTGTCYLIDNKKQIKWSDARDVCAGDNGTLAVLEPVDRAQFLSVFLNANSGFYSTGPVYYIGGTRAGNPNEPFPPSGPDYIWLTGDAVNMTATKPFWIPGKTIFEPEKWVLALRVYKNFSWTEAFDDKKQFYICQRSFILA